MKKAFIALLIILSVVLLALPAVAEGAAIEHWSPDSPAMQSIVSFVEASVDESSEGFIPVADRIAVFDMDGTLYGERFPTYFNDWLYINRALYDDGYEAPEELKAFAQAWEDKVLRGEPIEDFDALERELGPKLYKGLTPDEYADVVRAFKAMDVRGFSGMTYGEAYFQPMVSLVKYLCEHDYAVYIVSATYRDAVRVMTEGVLDEYIPYDHVIGTDLKYVASGDTDENSMFYELTPEDDLVIAGELFLKNQKTNKAAMIQQEIGRVPVLAFGNSTGDFSMATYTLSNDKYAARAYMLLCDDTERDYGDPEAAAKFKGKCDANGFYTVSERDEFESLYPDGVEMTSAEDGYQLEQVVVLSRHNIRAPLSNSGSAVAELTPHAWTEWTAPESELTLKGGVNETLMGQYFRKWLESESLIPENWIPEARQVRFYTNARQRTIATARYFAGGMLPIADVDIEYHGEIGAYDPVFKTVLTYVNDAYREAVQAQMEAQFGLWEDSPARQSYAEALALLSDVLDFDQSNGCLSGEYAPWAADDTRIELEEGKEATVKGSLKTAQAAAEALILQYYELDDANAAAFGHDLTDEEWLRLADLTTLYRSVKFGCPLIGVNAAHNMLAELLAELRTPDRVFTFLCGHDSNVATVLSALGVTEYELSGALERKTPIGVKLLFERWRSVDGEAYARVRLVYPSTEQLRDRAPMSLENPPMSFDVPLPGLERNADGYYRLDDVCACMQQAIDAYDGLVETYGPSETALDAAA